MLEVSFCIADVSFSASFMACPTNLSNLLLPPLARSAVQIFLYSLPFGLKKQTVLSYIL